MSSKQGLSTIDDNLKVEYLQTWWHVENQISPSDGFIVREVRDVVTCDNYINLKLPEEFVGLKVKGRNIGKELPFLETKKGFYILLGNLNQYHHNENNKAHIRYEVKYTINKPNFDRFWLHLGFKSEFNILEFIHPEFYLILPAGMKIREMNFLKSYLTNKISDSVFEFFSKKKEDYNKKSRIALNLYKNGDKKFHKKLKIESPYISNIGHKKKYSVIITKKSYDKIQKYKNEEGLRFEISYEVISELKFTLFPIMGVVFLIFVASRIADLLYHNSGNIDVVLSYLIVIVAFVTLYFTHIQEGYNIPFPWVTYSSIASLIIGILFEISFLPK